MERKQRKENEIKKGIFALIRRRKGIKQRLIIPHGQGLLMSDDGSVAGGLRSESEHVTIMT